MGQLFVGRVRFKPEWLGAVGLAWLVSAIILAAAAPIVRMLGKKVLTAIERLMGMLLAAVAIQMLLTGIAQFIAR